MGAVAEGLERMGRSGAPSGPEVDLIVDSAGSAEARIAFFRIAFGATSDHMISQAEVRSILEALTTGTRLSADWQPAEPQFRRDVQLAFLALQCCETALPYGGTLTFSHQDCWSVCAQAQTVNLDPRLWDGLNGAADMAQLTSATVQFGLLKTLTERQERQLSVRWTEDSIAIHF